MPKPKWLKPRHALEGKKRDVSGWFHPDIQKRIREIHRACPSCLGDLGTPEGEAIDGTPVCRKCCPKTGDKA